MDHQILRSLGPSTFPTIQKMAISNWEHQELFEIGEHPIFRSLSCANRLQTLILIDCLNGPFIRALDPDQNPPNLVLCPHLEELVFYINPWYLLDVEPLTRMAKNRASRGTELLSITFVGLLDRGPRQELLKLREHVAHVEYRLSVEAPTWDEILRESDGEREMVIVDPNL
jgi:hypothetical protein